LKDIQAFKIMTSAKRIILISAPSPFCKEQPNRLWNTSQASSTMVPTLPKRSDFPSTLTLDIIARKYINKYQHEAKSKK
jgi:hypothetical protein